MKKPIKFASGADLKTLALLDGERPRYLTLTQAGAILSLPLISAQVLQALLNGLYAEPGFSDVEARDLAQAVNVKVDVAKGALGHLVKLDLVTTDHTDVNGKALEFFHSPLYDDNSATTKDATACKAEALQLLGGRIHALTITNVEARIQELEAPKVTPQVPALPGMTPLGLKEQQVYRMGPSVVQIFQLDDPGVLEAADLYISKETKGYVELVFGSAHAAACFLKDLDDRSTKDGQYDQPLWYMAACKAAAAAMRKQGAK